MSDSDQNNTTDLVAELRGYATWSADAAHDPAVFTRAADEIERLQAEVVQLNQLVDHLEETS
jgi:hypothetical protein